MCVGAALAYMTMSECADVSAEGGCADLRMCERVRRRRMCEFSYLKFTLLLEVHHRFISFFILSTTLTLKNR